MFPLSQSHLPPDPAALRDALEQSLRRVLQPAGEMVAVEDRSYPQLAAIRLNLDGATVQNRPPQLPSAANPAEPALQVDELVITADPLRVQGAAVSFQCLAREVAVGQTRDREGNVVLVLQKAAEGTIEVSVAVAELEELIRAGAKVAAARQGVTIEDVRIEVRARGERALDGTVHVRAKKLFLGASVRISGSADLDEALTARLSSLICAGEGALGSLACGFLAPYLQRFDGKEFPLLALPLGEVKLRDVRVAAGSELRVSAQFGS